MQCNLTDICFDSQLFDSQLHKRYLPTGTDMATSCSLSSATPRNSPEYDDIIRIVHLVGFAAFTFVEFCNGLSSSSEAHHASVVSVTRWVNNWGVPHRFLILHVEDSTGNRNLCIRLDRRKDTQESSISSSSPSLASGELRSVCTLTCPSHMRYILIICRCLLHVGSNAS